MRGKRLGAGTFAALLICLLMLSGCALVAERPAKTSLPREDAAVHLDRGHWMLSRHDYEGALQECSIAFYKSQGREPGDEALLCMAAIYGDPLNKNKDYARSIYSLQRIVDDYPWSPRAELARIFVENFREQERLKRALSDSSQEQEKLKRQLNETAQEGERLKRRINEVSQETARLKKMVEEAKTVDVEMDEKKRNQAK